MVEIEVDALRNWLRSPVDDRESAEAHIDEFLKAVQYRYVRSEIDEMAAAGIQVFRCALELTDQALRLILWLEASDDKSSSFTQPSHLQSIRTVTPPSLVRGGDRIQLLSDPEGEVEKKEVRGSDLIDERFLRSGSSDLSFTFVSALVGSVSGGADIYRWVVVSS